MTRPVRAAVAVQTRYRVLASRKTEGADGVFSQYKSDTVFRSTVGGRHYSLIFKAGPKKCYEKADEVADTTYYIITITSSCNKSQHNQGSRAASYNNNILS